MTRREALRNGRGLRRGLRIWPPRLLLLCLLLLARRVAFAQSAPQIQVQSDRETLGVGDVVHIQMSATSSVAMPSAPQLGGTSGFAVRGQNASPSQTLISINGQRMDSYALTVEWMLLAQRVGTFRVGPASVVVGGARFASAPLSLRVVPAGQVPAARPPPQPQPLFPQSPFRFSPFDPWRGLLQGLDPNQGLPSSPQPPPVAFDQRLALDAPRGAFYFLHSTIDKSSVVVGEQVLFSVYEYFDLGANVGLDNDGHDASVADFVKHPLVPEDQEAPRLGYASVGGRPWEVKLLRRWALFPLHSGDLPIGPMSVTLLEAHTPGGSKRETETWRVHVTESPAAGRPTGYALGDVGRFSLTAQVSPRRVDRGAAVGVHVEISGTGNLPGAIATPARQGVEWLTPEVHEKMGPVGQESFGGTRSFDFVVRVLRSGDVDLGELSLPFWDPDHRRYEVARAPLGTVQVTASPLGPAALAEAAPELLPGLPAPRDTLEGSPSPHAHPDDSPLFWLAAVCAGPAVFGIAVAGRAAGRRVIGSWRQRRASPTTELRERVAAARAACDTADARAADAAIARALQAATLAHAGVSVRGAVGDEVITRLERVGVDREVASGVADLLRDCEAARFSPNAAESSAARERWLRAQQAIRRLEGRG